MGKPAACVGDTTGHLFSPMVPGTGSANVIIRGKFAWRAVVDNMVCPVPLAPPAPAPHGPEKCYLGSFGVLINNQMAVRMGDQLVGPPAPPNPIVFCAASIGPPAVLIGDIAFGLADPAIMSDYCKAFCDLMKQWDSLTPEQRRQGLENVINQAMRQAGVPDVGVNMASGLSGTNTYGELDFQNWNIDVNPDIVNGPMTQARATQLSNTLYHEGRHADQWYAMAQRQAGNGVSATNIQSNMAIPGRVAQSAAANPLTRDSARGVMGDAMHRSVYGSRAAYRNNVLGPSGTYDEYRALPEESDAWATGDATGGVAGCGSCPGL